MKKKDLAIADLAAHLGSGQVQPYLKESVVISSLEEIGAGHGDTNPTLTTLKDIVIASGILETEELRLAIAGNEALQENVITAAVESILMATAGKIEQKAVSADVSRVFPGREAGAMEALQDVTKPDNLARSAYLAAVTAANNKQLDVAFTPHVLAAKESGLLVEVRQPEVYTRVASRNADGSPMALNRRGLMDFLRTPTDLDFTSTKLVPVAVAGNADKLAAASDVPDASAIVGGKTIVTRPIKTGIEVDLIRVCTSDAILSGGVLSDTDELDENLGIKTVYVKLTNGTDNAVVAIDVSNHTTTTFVQNRTGAMNIFSLNAIVDVNLPTTSRSGALATVLDTAVGAAHSTKLLGVKLRITGTMDAETATVTVDAGSFAFTSIVDRADQSNVAAKAAVDALNAAITGTIMYYDPLGNRSNTNLRASSQIVDAGTPSVYMLPARRRSPIETLAPKDGAGRSLSVDSLRQMNYIRQMGDVETVITSISSAIAEGTVGRRSGAFIGSQYVTPYLFKPAAAVNLTDLVLANTSDVAFSALSTAITDNLMTAGQRALAKSGWLAAKMLRDGNQDGYVLVAIGDHEILQYVNNTVTKTGSGYTPVATLPLFSDSMKGKVVIVPAITTGRDGSGIDPLTFGARITAPSYVGEVEDKTGGQTHRRTAFQPREDFYCVCPVMAEVEFEGLEQILVTVSPKS